MAGLEFELIATLGVVAFFAGILDAVAGGGGLLALPALLLAGIDPAAALGTNKLQAVFGSASATWRFARLGMIDWKHVWRMAFAAGIGGAVGAACVHLVPRSALQITLPFLLIAIALFFAVSKSVRDDDAAARLSLMAFTFTAAFGIGFYDGVFGPGTGAFFMLAFVTLLGFGVRRATAHTKLLNFSSNLGSLSVFAFSGTLIIPLGLVMGAAQFAGAQLGAHLALRFGARLIRPLLVIISIAVTVKLLIDPANPLRVMILSWFS
jgi:uncharacterized membrane protein YfcA